MTPPTPPPANNTFNISNSTLTNVAGSGAIHYNESAATDSVVAETAVTEATHLDRQVILFLAANPLATHQLRLDEEVREIAAGLQRAKHRDRFDLKQQWALRPRDLQRAMHDCAPQIVHFSGHGVGASTASSSLPETERNAEIKRDIALVTQDTAAIAEGLILEAPNGQPRLVTTAALSALFELFAESVSCVVLNACYSEQQARAIAQHVPFVIGMNQAIGDRAAIEFSIGFYDALGAGDPIERAYQSGLVALKMAGIDEALTPQLLQHSQPKQSL